MTSSDESILRIISAAGAAYANDIAGEDRDIMTRLRQLRDDGWIEFCYIGQDRSRIGYQLTLKGKDFLSTLDKERQNHAADEAKEKEKELRAETQRKQDRRQDYAVAAFGAAVGSILTLLVEHFGEILQLLRKLAQR